MTLDIEKMKAAALAATQGIWAFGSFHRLLVVPVSDDGHHDKNSPIADLGETEIPWDATEDSKTRYNNAIHIAGNVGFKKTLEHDDEYKGKNK